MRWETFWTWVTQGTIVFILLVLAVIVIGVVWDSFKKGGHR